MPTSGGSERAADAWLVANVLRICLCTVLSASAQAVAHTDLTSAAAGLRWEGRAWHRGALHSTWDPGQAYRHTVSLRRLSLHRDTDQAFVFVYRSSWVASGAASSRAVRARPSARRTALCAN